MDLGLADRVYVITGASRGLGLASARALVAEGARVAIVARPSDALDAAVTALGTSAIAVPADLADADAAEHAVESALGAFGRLDGALLSVGGPPPGSVLTTTDDQWRASFDSVFLASSRMARAVCTGIASWRAGGNGLAGLGAVDLGSGGVHRPDHQQRPEARPGDAGQGPGRRGGPDGDPGQRAAAGAHRHRPPRCPGCCERRRGSGARPGQRPHPSGPVWGARGVSAGSPPSS